MGHRSRRSKRGVTMVELIVSATLLVIFLGALVGLMSPFMKVFLRVQTLNHAQSVASIVLDTLREELASARGYVKLYRDGDVFGATGASAGETATAVEFENIDGYITLIDANGCPKTELRKRNGDFLQTQEALNPGRLLMRYFAVAKDSNDNEKMTYYYQDAAGTYVARALTTVYGSGFYVNNNIRLEFSVSPADPVTGRVNELTATVIVTNPEDGATRFSQTAVLDMVYAPLLRTDATATVKADETTPP